MFGYLLRLVTRMVPDGSRPLGRSPGTSHMVPPDGSVPDSCLASALAPTRLISQSSGGEPLASSSATSKSRMIWHARDVARSRRIISDVDSLIVDMPTVTDIGLSDPTVLVNRAKYNSIERDQIQPGFALRAAPSEAMPLDHATVLVTSRNRSVENAKQ